MTTPERLRRRQRFEGVVLIVLAAAMVVQSFYFNFQDQKQRDCFAENFSEFARVSVIRSNIAAEESLINSQKDQLFKQVIIDVAAADEPEEFRQAFRTFMIEDTKLVRAKERLQQNREDNPVPPFPSGTCEE